MHIPFLEKRNKHFNYPFNFINMCLRLENNSLTNFKQ
jgi:hypothetical protein